MKTKTIFTPQEARKHFKAREVFTLHWKNETKRNTLTEANLGPCETSMMELFCQRNDIFAKIAIIDNCQDPKYASTEDNRICKYCLDCRKTVSKVLA